jgi:hypothetical protein
MKSKVKHLKVPMGRNRLNPFVGLNKNIEALASHLYAYANVLKQCDSRSAPKQSIR